MKIIYWDLDGVLRDLCTPCFGFHPDNWSYKVNNKKLLDIISENRNILLEAPTYNEYLEVYNKIGGIILTSQPNKNIYLTDKWIKKNIGNVDVIYVKNAQEKLNYLKDGAFLIDDYPFYNSYKKIITIDRPYNRDCNSIIRIYNQKQLLDIINSL